MALVCPACGTENRAVAKFCIECIGALQPDFEPTQVVSRRASSESTTLLGMPTALVEFGSATPQSSPAPALATNPAAPRRTGAAEPRKGLWLSVAAFAITLAVGAGGWMIAGAGGWYIYSATANANASTGPAIPDAPVLPEAAPVVAPQPLPPAVVTVAVATPTARATSTAPATPVAKARPVAPVAAPRAIAASDPGAACADLGFLARPRCLATQCAKSETRGHPVCQAVVAQQRLMEEKRNPTLAN